MLGGLLVEFFACGLHSFHALGVSRYDYLAMRQSEPALAEALAHAYAVLRNTLRGDGERRYLSRVARQDLHASANLWAAERGFSYSHRGARPAARAAAPRAPAAVAEDNPASPTTATTAVTGLKPRGVEAGVVVAGAAAGARKLRVGTRGIVLPPGAANPRPRSERAGPPAPLARRDAATAPLYPVGSGVPGAAHGATRVRGSRGSAVGTGHHPVRHQYRLGVQAHPLPVQRVPSERRRHSVPRDGNPAGAGRGVHPGGNGPGGGRRADLRRLRLCSAHGGQAQSGLSLQPRQRLHAECLVQVRDAAGHGASAQPRRRAAVLGHSGCLPPPHSAARRPHLPRFPHLRARLRPQDEAVWSPRRPPHLGEALEAGGPVAAGARLPHHCVRGRLWGRPPDSGGRPRHVGGSGGGWACGARAPNSAGIQDAPGQGREGRLHGHAVAWPRGGYPRGPVPVAREAGRQELWAGDLLLALRGRAPAVGPLCGPAAFLRACSVSLPVRPRRPLPPGQPLYGTHLPTPPQRRRSPRPPSPERPGLVAGPRGPRLDRSAHLARHSYAAARHGCGRVWVGRRPGGPPGSARLPRHTPKRPPHKCVGVGCRHSGAPVLSGTSSPVAPSSASGRTPWWRWASSTPRRPAPSS